MTVSFFDRFTPDEAARIEAAGTRVTLPAGWSPIWERTPADKAYVVLSGEVSVRVKGKEIARLGAGEIVGEAAILRRTLRSATIVAVTPLELLHLTSEAVRDLELSMPRFREVLAEILDERIPA
ncbi:Crp/Fnr family transcriptional regulator [Nocardioides massiliensis]|uniref:CRP-like cAMP-binding protein n=1 Tax=Nocardioides massiliensis TaxID=1325935 RepID=A0ABT9NM61_9ACTN|nr:cyclic nucleotide-binding domain-containing protein [Nocardioides massiliensis]MDP9821513.1 CRP-like cAMP-binding protein [Nocardioides massiliensis]